MAAKVELRFRWETPAADDRWNDDNFGGVCVSVGRIEDGQVVARVFSKKREKYGEDYSGQHVYRESATDKSSRHVCTFSNLDTVQTFVETFLFGALTPRIRCVSCGLLADIDNTNNTDKLRAAARCFFCDIWLDRIACLTSLSPRVAIIDGVWYTVDPNEGAPSHCKGFGGARHEIEWTDGRRLVTTNLWSGGEAPEHLRAQLPDNARFVGKEAKPDAE